MRKETREQINNRMNEGNQRTKEREKGRKIMEGITFLHCQLTKQQNKTKQKTNEEREEAEVE